MNAIMILKHRPLLWPDVRLGYYIFPATCLLSMTIPLVLSQLGKMGIPAAFNGLAVVLLFAAIVGNIYALPAHADLLRAGHLKEYYENSPKLLAALKHIKDADYQPPQELVQAANYRATFEYFKNRQGLSN
jgi:hypothetical protein